MKVAAPGLQSAAMGQMVAVTEQPSATRGVVRYELNRALTGMGHEYFRSAADAVGSRPADELARRLFATGHVHSVHIYSNIVTVELERGGRADDLPEAIRTLYRYWQPGMRPPAFADLVADDDSAAAAAPAAAGEGVDPALAAAMARVPAALLERGRVGRERWMAKIGG
jgi:hypothetical protein